MFDIEPDLVDGTDKRQILLAHLTIHGNEHYDAVSKATNESSNAIESSMPTINQLSHATETTPEKSQNEEPVVTPHKTARYVSAAKRRLYRKRQSKPEDRKTNKRKRRQAEGLEYTGKTGIFIPAISVKKKDSSKCKFKCSSKITEDHE